MYCAHQVGNNRTLYLCLVIQVLMDMFFQDEDDPSVERELVEQKNRSTPKYDEIVKDLVLEMTQYIRDLEMIIRVFRHPIHEICTDKHVSRWI